MFIYIFLVLCFNVINKSIVIFMVGLLVRGKTYMLKKFIRYLNWIGIRIKGRFYNFVDLVKN